MAGAPTTILTGKGITLKFGAVEYEQQTTSAYITEEIDTEDVEPLGAAGKIQIIYGRQHTLHLEGIQDWTETSSLFGLLNAAAIAGTPVAFTLVLANPTTPPGTKATASGTVQGIHGQFGGDKTLKGSMALPCVTYVPPVQAVGP